MLDYIHPHKTAALIRASLRVGAALCGAGAAQMRALSVAGADLGLAFQIVDDILDVDGELGRARQDGGQGPSAAEGDLSRRSRHRGLPARAAPSARDARSSRDRAHRALGAARRPSAPIPSRAARRDFIARAERPEPCPRSPPSTLARSSTRAEIPPSRSRSSSSPAPAAAPSCRRAPPPASARPSSCATATTSATAARASAARCRTSTRPSRRRSTAWRRASRRRSTGAARAGRHAEQVGARRQRHPRRLARGGARRRRRRRACRSTRTWAAPGARILPVPLMNVLNGGAHADNGLDFQEFMLVPAGAGSFATRSAWGWRSSTPSRSSSRTRGSRTGVGDEGGFAPALARQHGGARLPAAGHRARRLPARRRRVRWRSTSRPASSPSTAATACARDNTEKSSEEMIALLRGALRPLSDLLDRGRPGRGRLGGLARADAAPRRPRAARGRRPLRDQPGDPPAGHPEGHRQRRAGQGQPDRHADRDAARPSSWPSARATAPSSPTARARRRTPSSPTSRWPSTRARSRPARWRAASAPPSTTSSCASRRSWARPRSGRARGVYAARAAGEPARCSAARARPRPPWSSLAYGGQSLARVWQMKHEIESLERDIARLRAETERLTAHRRPPAQRSRLHRAAGPRGPRPREARRDAS